MVAQCTADLSAASARPDAANEGCSGPRSSPNSGSRQPRDVAAQVGHAVVEQLGEVVEVVGPGAGLGARELVIERRPDQGGCPGGKAVGRHALCGAAGPVAVGVLEEVGVDP